MLDKASRTLTLILTILIFSVAQAAPASGQNLAQKSFGKKHRGVFGAKVGILNRATYRVDGEEFETKVGWSGQVYWGVPASPQLLIVPYIEFNDIKVFSEHQWAIDVGLSLKYHIYDDKGRVSHKPGVGVGYAHLAIIGQLERTDYMTVRAFWETIFFTEGRHAWILEGVVYAAPVGGNSEVRITYGPVVQLRFGVLY